MTYNIVDGYDAELVDELINVRRKIFRDSGITCDTVGVASILIAYALCRICML